MGCREAGHVGKGIKQQGFQSVAVTSLQQVFKILLGEGPAQAWCLFDPPVDVGRGNAGAVPESRFKIVRCEGMLEQLWKVESSIHIETPAFAGTLVIHDKQGVIQQAVAGSRGPGKAGLPGALAEDSRGFHGLCPGRNRGAQP